MGKISLQNKANPLKGTVESYWFENENTGLKKTLFHSITIPLTPFDPGLDYEEQPEETEISIEWLSLNLNDPKNLDNLLITSKLYKGVEASIYVGSAHNPCEIKSMKINRVGDDSYSVEGELFIHFEHEGVGKNERYIFNTIVDYIENK